MTNEYVKILKKVSTKIMIILMILAAVGFCGVLRYGKSQMDSYSYSGYNGSDTVNYSEEISWLKQTKPEGWEDDVAFYEYLQESGITYDDARLNVAYTVDSIEIPFETKLEILDPIMKNNDWQSTCRLMAENTADEAEKWEYNYRIENNIPFGDEWQDDVIYDIVAAKQNLTYGAEGEEASENENIITLGLYRLEHNIPINIADADCSLDDIGSSDQVNFWFAMFMSSNLLAAIGLLIMIIAGGCIANEFSQGTIKFLLINPAKRGKILMSKYFTVISFGCIMMAVFFITMVPMAGLMLGFDGIGAPYLTVENGTVKELSPLLHAIKLYLLNSVQIAVMATFALAVSSLAKNAALAIGSSVFLMLAGNTIVAVLQQFNQDWARYILFANTNLSAIASGNSSFPRHTLFFAVAVIVVHMIVFILTMWDGFTKREV